MRGRGREEKEKPLLVLTWRVLGVQSEPHLIDRLLERTCNLRAYPGSEFVANTLDKWNWRYQKISTSCYVFNSLRAISNFCHLLITFAINLDPDQARQNVETV